MPLQLHHLPDSHIPRFSEISTNAFFDASDPCNRAMFPSPPTPDTYKSMAGMNLESRQKRGNVFLGVYDVPTTTHSQAPRGVVSDAPLPPPESMIAGARLRLEDPVTFAEPPKVLEAPPSANADAYYEFFRMLAPARRDAMGCSTYWVLEMLATETAQQGRGAGRLIMEWLVREMGVTRVEIAGKAERGQRVGDVGVSGFLEAMIKGKPLYEKMGFGVVQVLEMDCRKYGGEGVGRNYVMVRPAEARKANGIANGVAHGSANGSVNGSVNGSINGVNGH